mmetsp:Transcript_64204/g.152149  ORF Transcript_64204/g.152149 Transcript_64204/m.152149 type:complete len:1045 (+) Transcript_64204:26-3160(+)
MIRGFCRGVSARTAWTSKIRTLGSVDPKRGQARAFTKPTTPSPAPASSQAKANESFLSGTGGMYVEQLYEQWLEDPTTVHTSWQAFFTNLDADVEAGNANVLPPSLAGGVEPSMATEDPIMRAAIDHMKLLLLVRSYQVRGHYSAHLDPLNINSATIDMESLDALPSFLDYRNFGFVEADLDRTFHMGASAVGASSAGVLSHTGPQTLRAILSTLHEAYCGTIGVEFMHIPDMEQQNWIRNKFEKANKFEHTKADIDNMYDRLTFACHFESFLATKYGVTKRFGLEGVESSIPGMKALIDRAVEMGVEAVTIGMPHRGRLNVLANVIRKPMEDILAEFKVGPIAADNSGDNVLGSGDVKYHLGMSMDRPTTCGKMVHLSLVANPSHLEAVNPVVLGKTRAKQFYMGDNSRRKVMSVLLHGDAAFAGQGVVYETLGLSDIKGYTTGGTVHIIVNNQIGFTTDPRFARTSPYCTDVAKTVAAPIFHVNADDLEAVCWVCRQAAEFRQTFGKDVIIDIVGYRRYGHNEVDEPSFTQPIMYQHIAKTKPILQKFQEEAMAKGMLSQEDIDREEKVVNTIFEEAFEKSRNPDPTKAKPLWFESSWQGFKSQFEQSIEQVTGLPRATLLQLGDKISSYPKDFNIHKGLARVMANKKNMFATGEGIDWATAEALAFGSLLSEKVHVRLSGQDVERGTFSHRHAVLHDQINESKLVPLDGVSPDQAEFSVFNSNLSEYAVLGFELGYSIQNPMSLVIWEAQFGDFANTAQVIIDQFVSSGEQKWLRQSGLVMLLPHGYEGQGPEHSSARLERFLQMSDDDPSVIPDNMAEKGRMQIQNSNWQICNISTPANYYHALRRQVRRDFRKPLVVMSPKSLLRHPECVSPLIEFDVEAPEPHRSFRRLMDERTPALMEPLDKIVRIIVCSGKVYYDLVKWRRDNKVTNVVVTSMEQIAPFPYDRIQVLVKKYPNAEISWVQEEPQNMGAWSYVEPRANTALAAIDRKMRITYFGRNPAASPATGNVTIHQAEMEQFLAASFDATPAPEKMEPIRWRY